ncbi:hypothetical protein [Halorussus sp. MSC15.2]|uniref:hypothetical protein n=1 Tax=Halorussus sp. MSC15.2 TaxID=2283638 RepID=UPI0013D8AE18|nr:hypothetical protein [Halorussus sp. MSC15.2]NEU57421.1 hypothetical protein [Halorussus sp. MSC15.2]
MRRRDILRNCAALGATASVGVLAGCAGGGGDSESGQSAALSKESFDFREGESGNLVVSVTLKNAGEVEGTGNLYVTVTAAERTDGNQSDGNQSDGGDDGTVASRESMEVTVPAGETKTVELAFGISYEQFSREGSINVDFRP